MKKRNVIALAGVALLSAGILQLVQVVLNHLAQATVKNSHMSMRLSQKT